MNEELAQAIRDASFRHAHALHPGFLQSVNKLQLSGEDYIESTRSAHNPLTDLRMRRDDSTGELFTLNLRALKESGMLPFATMAGPVNDQVTLDSAATLGIAVANQEVVMPIPDAKMDPVVHYSTMAKYVNVFGSWGDAEAYAKFLVSQRDCIPHTERTGLLLSTLGIVTGLSSSSSNPDELFERAIEASRNEVEKFFIHLRWATLKGKRDGDYKSADAILMSGLNAMQRTSLPDEDKIRFRGMVVNLQALFRLRTGQVSESRHLVHAAVADLLSAYDAGTELRGGEAARYTLMALLNDAQLSLLEGDIQVSTRKYQRAVDFARINDSDDGLASSLAALAFVRLRALDYEGALPLLKEALTLLRRTHEPRIFLHVRKMLYFTYSKLGRQLEAVEIESMSEFYWLIGDGA